jgi:hypothetical protein
VSFSPVQTIAACCLLLCLAGCATFSEAPPQAAKTLAVATAAPDYWWYVRFRLRWPEGEQPLWYPDLFIADQVIGPMLNAEAAPIKLWRFHRRAARDHAGRQFSFIFRASAETARRINTRIAAHPLLAQWQRQGVIRQVLYDDPAKPRRPGIGDTSDASWTPEMQRAWPYFIMGVSRLWLELIREYAQASNLPEDPQARYAALSQTLDARWRAEGGHALLHHLSAVFGYQEVEVVRRQVLRF